VDTIERRRTSRSTNYTLAAYTLAGKTGMCSLTLMLLVRKHSVTQTLLPGDSCCCPAHIHVQKRVTNLCGSRCPAAYLIGLDASALSSTLASSTAARKILDIIVS
jgi:hypothetical protein